jgi:hypothetical protein
MSRAAKTPGVAKLELARKKPARSVATKDFLSILDLNYTKITKDTKITKRFWKSQIPQFLNSPTSSSWPSSSFVAFVSFVTPCYSLRLWRPS